MSAEDYNFWSLIINALIAIGTLAAVIVALYLASRQNNPKIIVYASIVSIHNMANVNPEQKYVHVSAINSGIIDEYISTFGYTIGIFFIKQDVIVIPWTNNFEPRFPGTTKPGGCVSDFIEIERFEEIQLDFFTTFFDDAPIPNLIKRQKWFPKLAMKTAKCWVRAPRSKKIITGRMDKTLVEYILSTYAERQNSKNNEA